MKRTTLVGSAVLVALALLGFALGRGLVSRGSGDRGSRPAPPQGREDRPTPPSLVGTRPDLAPAPSGENSQIAPAEGHENDVVVEVVDATGRPVPRATLLVTTEGEDGQTTWPAIEVEAGAHRFPRAWLARFTKVSIETGDARSTEGEPLNLRSANLDDVDLEAGPITIRLAPGRRIEGALLDDGGAPLSGIRVEAAGRHATTDAAGRFVLAGLPLEEVIVRIDAEPPWRPVAPLAVPREETSVEIRLARGDRLDVRVLDPEGRPVPDLPLELGNGTWRAEGKTDAHGVLVAEGVPPDRPLRIWAMTSYVELPYPIRVVHDVDPRVGEMTLRLEAPSRVEGDLVDEEGGPVLDAYVSARTVEGESLGPGGHWDPDGRTNHFVLACVPAGPLVLRAGRRTARNADPDPIEIRAPVEGVRIVLARATTLRGRVLDDDREGLVLSFTSGDLRYDADLGPDGSFVVKGVPDRAGTIYACQSATGRCALREDVRPSDGPVEIRLQPGHTYTGRVEGREKRGETEWSVSCTRGRLLVGAGGYVGEDGRFTIRGVPPGRWVLTLWAGETRLATVPAAAQDAGDVVLTLPEVTGR